MELRQLELFVAVAEERNFRRAAERCRIAQPALSRRIQALERSVGARLLARTTRAVELTPAGAAFLDAARGALAGLARGADAARRLEAGERRVVVAFVEYANFPFVPRLLKRFADRHADVAVERRELPPTQQIAALRAGEIDVGFLGVPAEARQRAAGGAARGDAQLAFVPVMRTAWAVALPAAHPLARPPLVSASTASDATPRAAADRGRPAIPVAAYAAEPLVLFPRNMNPGLYDWTLDCVQRAGAAAPRVVQEPAQLHTALGLVAAGVGVMPTPFHLADQRRPGVAVRPTSGFGPGARICAVYRRDHQTAVLTAFLEAVRDTARELRPDHNGSGQRRPEVQTGRS